MDLDTVMPGLVLYDFGDLVRTTTISTAEDEIDSAKVSMRLPMFEALVKGYLDGANGFLTDTEIDLLPFSGRLITLEVAIRSSPITSKATITSKSIAQDTTSTASASRPPSSDRWKTKRMPWRPWSSVGEPPALAEVSLKLSLKF